jgi:hypothetical protein
MKLLQSLAEVWLLAAAIMSLALYLAVLIQGLRGKTVGRQPWEAIATVLHFVLVAPITLVMAIWVYLFRRRRFSEKAVINTPRRWASQAATWLKPEL